MTYQAVDDGGKADAFSTDDALEFTLIFFVPSYTLSFRIHIYTKRRI